MHKRIFVAFLVLSGFAHSSGFETDFVQAAQERMNHRVTYDGRYIAIPYPGGDVPDHLGVCTDVVIRSYRKLGVDLQVLVHEDMDAHFDLYPSKRIWGLNSPDENIDHRRVPNLQTFFNRHGESLSISTVGTDYQPGSMVTWMLPGNLPHIGIVSATINPRSGNPMIIHNIGSGPTLEDMLFKYEITGHYKYVPESYGVD